MKLIVCVLTGSAAEAARIRQGGGAASTFAIFLTKKDDQEPVWDIAQKMYYPTDQRDRFVERLAQVASDLTARESQRVDRVAKQLLRDARLSAHEVKALVT